VTIVTTDEEICCLFCKAPPEVAAVRTEGPILVCVNEPECISRWALRHQVLEAAALVVRAERG
jgi:hypothetical protein